MCAREEDELQTEGFVCLGPFRKTLRDSKDSISLGNEKFL